MMLYHEVLSGSFILVIWKFNKHLL